MNKVRLFLAIWSISMAVYQAFQAELLWMIVDMAIGAYFIAVLSLTTKE